MKYLKVWKQLANCAINSYFSNRINYVAFFIGKLIRFGFFLLLIISIFRFTKSLAGYSKYEVILFFLTFNLIDVLTQALFRGIYLFKRDVRTGNFDYIISKPINSLFYCLSRLVDIADIIFLIPIIALIIYTILKLSISITILNIIYYLIFIFLGLLITLSIHIVSASITIWTMESENFIWFYRESMAIGRFPPEIFSSSMQFIFTFIMPIIIIVAFPAKALLGILGWQSALVALIYSISFFILSLLIWKKSLKYYSSASS